MPKLKAKFNWILEVGDKNKDGLEKELEGEAKEYHKDGGSQ